MGPYSEEKQLQRAEAIRFLLENNPHLPEDYKSIWKKHLANLALNESRDQAVFLAEIREVATVTSRAMGETLLIGGNPENITSANPAVMRYLMSVSDPAAYAQAFSSFVGQNPGVGVSYLSSMMADGTNPETHVVLNYANSVGELFINQPQTLEGWAEYSSAVKDLRTIESTAVATEVKRWIP